MSCRRWIPTGLTVVTVALGARPAVAATVDGAMRGAQTSRKSTAHPRYPRALRPMTQVCATPTGVTPTVGGKYLGQLRRLHVPGDCAAYGPFTDYGRYPATSYAGHPNLPAAYWVYHYPYWYLYAQKRPARVTAPARRTCRTVVVPTPSVGGKYRGLVRRLHVPGDCAAYGSFNDYGHYPQTSYAGQANLPAAYWVYSYPYWYLWRQKP